MQFKQRFDEQCLIREFQNRSLRNLANFDEHWLIFEFHNRSLCNLSKGWMRIV